MHENFSVYDLVKWGDNYLKARNIENPFNESLLIAGHILGQPPGKVIISYNDGADGNAADLFKRLIERRGEEEPYAYITNKKEFYSLDFYVDGSVLIPRPDTECLVDEALREIKKLSKILKRKTRVLDIGTGSGAIAISIAKNSDNVIIYAADNSNESLEIAKKNAAANGVTEKVVPVYFDMMQSSRKQADDGLSARPRHSDLGADSGDYGTQGGGFDDFDGFDIIISNPPYVETGELKTLDDGVRLYEPAAALDGGADGLAFYRKILEMAASANKNRKTVILEIDYRKKAEIYSLYKEKFNGRGIKFKRIAFINDLNYRERAVKITYG